VSKTRNQTSCRIYIRNSFEFLKGVLYARSSRLIPDKANLGFRSCDGPGRGGTCQVPAWTMYSWDSG
jgi:hypothetical protein